MEKLREIIAKALRLGPSSKEALADEIDRNIKTARAEMIRSGVSVKLAESDNVLVEDAIITYTMMRMGDTARMDNYKNSWEYQLDCIRKSTIDAESGENADV